MKFLYALLTIIPLFVGAQPAFELSTGVLPSGPTGGQTMDVAVADLNGDGYPDIVLAKEWDRNGLLLSNGPGTFVDASANFLNEKNDTEDIAIADFDGNGWLDIVFAAEDNARHEMYLNQGQGNFISVSQRLPSFVSNVVVTTDLNGDGIPDLVFGNDGQNVVLINDGSGNFKDETLPRMPVKFDVTQDLLLVDVDNDGDLDMAVGNEDGNRLLINDGSGVFSDQTASRLPQGVIMETRKVSSADVNGDGYADLYYCNMASSAGKDIKDRLYLNDGNGKFIDVSATNIPPYQRHSFDAVFHDFNNDGHQDFIVGYLQQQIPGVFINDGSGKFSDQTSTYLPATTRGDNIGIIVKDMNNDEKPDIYLGRFRQQDQLLFRAIATTSNTGSADPENNIFIFPNPATQSVTIESKGTCSEESMELAISDLNGKEMFRSKYEKAGLIELALDSLSKGAYVLIAKTRTCRLEEKIILQ